MRINILTFTEYYLPGYKSGGPVRTITNMVNHLGDKVKFHIVTLDRDALDTKPYQNIKVHTWCEVGKAQVYYIAPEFFLFNKLVNLIKATEHDILYLNSFFNPKFTGLMLLARLLGLLPKRPIVLAPRGEFSEGALAIKSWKKKLYLGVSQFVGLYRDLTWQASSNFEAEDIKRVIGTEIASHIVVAPDLPPVLGWEPRVAEPEIMTRKGEGFRIVFLSRITVKKNINFALKILAQVKAPVEFSIVGPIRDEKYWRKCKDLIMKLPLHVRVDVVGSVDHSQVSSIMERSNLFFLPTMGENYGHVIAEALSVGTPVLIADTTPWRGLAEAGVGWDLPLKDEQAFVNAIEFAAQVNPKDYDAWRCRVKAYAMEKLSDVEIVNANHRLFVDLLNSEMPA